MNIPPTPRGYAQTRLDRPMPTTLRPFECADCGWTGHLELAWDGTRFSHVSDCPVHTGSALDEWQ